jgi:xanthine phosphoribosyltransferase
MGSNNRCIILKERKYSWNYIHKACTNLAQQVTDREYNMYIALSRGGLVPGAILASLNNVGQLQSIGVKSYDKRKQGEIYIYQHPLKFERKNILVIDDLSDNGRTLNYIRQYLLNNGANRVSSACIFAKRETNHTPSYVYKYIPKEQWVVFPWEV